jgi:hypothetical protein
MSSDVQFYNHANYGSTNHEELSEIFRFLGIPATSNAAGQEPKWRLAAYTKFAFLRWNELRE